LLVHVGLVDLDPQIDVVAVGERLLLELLPCADDGPVRLERSLGGLGELDCLVERRLGRGDGVRVCVVGERVPLGRELLDLVARGVEGLDEALLLLVHDGRLLWSGGYAALRVKRLRPTSVRAERRGRCCSTWPPRSGMTGIAPPSG